MHVERVAEPGDAWDAFAAATPGAALGHAAAWSRVFAEAYGLSSICLTARGAGGRLEGILPLVRCPRPLGGVQLVSQPFLDSGGILAASEAAEAALCGAALELLGETGPHPLELRQTAALRAGPEAPPVARVDLFLPLEGEEEAQWRALPGAVRNQTRKAQREGLTIAEGSIEELLDGFYAAFAVNMRDLGSPPHSRGFFRAMADAFGDGLRLIVTRHGSRPIGGLVAIHRGETVSVPWASTLRSERARCPNNLIYWEALRWAVGRGARELDFGRSPPGSGSHRFKRGWGARERSLPWLRLDAAGNPRPFDSLDAGGLLRALSGAWTRLPVPVATALGSRLRRFFAN